MARNKYNIDEELITKFNYKQFRRLLQYVKPYRNTMAGIIALMLFSSVANALGVYIIKDAIDVKIPGKDIKGLATLAAIFLMTLVTNGICLKLRILTMSKVGQSIIHKLREDLFVHLQELPFTYYDSRPHGKILIRVVNYVNSLSDLLSNGIINFVTELFNLVVIIVFMLAIDPRLTAICMAGLPLLAAAIFSIKNAQRRAWQKVNNKSSNLNAYIHESILGMKVTQSFAREDKNLGLFKEASGSYRSAWLNAMKINLLLGPSIDNISMLTISAVYILGISWVDKGVTVGVLVAFMGYIGRFWAPITNIANFANQLIIATSHVERIFEAMDEKPTVTDVPGAIEMPKVQGGVEFKNVTFSYDTGNPILKNVSFNVSAGDTIALVGPTGAGKTTVVNLISRFYDIDSGNILIDETDIKGVTLRSLRSQMGIMLQDSFIFSGTIMDNIRYSKLDATDEEVINAAKAVKAHDFIMAMKDGYNTEVNERGSRLSVGQRQLISFARALLADPRILILDEATSSIDTKTEMALQQGLERLLKGRTSFIIAHRLSTIQNSTRIMYIDDGRIVEQGSHDELMRRKGAYYKLYISQFEMLDAI